MAGTLLLSGKKRELTFGLQKSDERVVKRGADMQLIETREMIN
jgi:hypothetical protein